MLVLNPRRGIYKSQGKLVSFASLRRFFFWPQTLASELSGFLRGNALSSQLRSVLLEQEILSEEGGQPEVFPLREVRAGGWTNSSLGISLLQQNEGPLTVLDGLSFKDFEAMPAQGALAYIGPQPFYAATTASDDGLIPCTRCLILRFLSSYRAAPALYWALREGAQVFFSPCENSGFRHSLPPGEGVTVWGQEKVQLREVLPLPTCKDCLARSAVKHFSPGPFAPISKLVSAGPVHSALLPEMLWLAGQDSVGGGSSYDADPTLGRKRALNEALERYSAHFLPLATTKAGLLFHSNIGSRRFSLRRALLIKPGSISTGLACRESLESAIADALKEVIERDALARFWLFLAKGKARFKRLDYDEKTFLAPPKLKIFFLQLQSFKLPVVLCILRNQDQQQVTGSACGPLKEAMAKAFAEGLQNFSYFSGLEDMAVKNPDNPKTYHEHALLYWAKIKKMPELTDLACQDIELKPLPAPVYHAQITPFDLALLGKHSVRVIVPELIYPPMAHADWKQMLSSCKKLKLSPPQEPHPFA